MYRCQVTGKISKRGEKLNRIVVATRERIYTEMVWEDDQQVEIEVAHGWEIVREINASDAGLAIWNAASDDEKQRLVKSI